MTTARDYVEIGINRLPEKGRGPLTVRYLSIYLREIVAEEIAALQVLDAIQEWNAPTAEGGPSFVYDVLGKLIGHPRPSGFGDADYRFILQARVLARSSDATFASVYKVVRHLARGQPFDVVPSVPEHWTIYFTLALDEQWQSLYRRLLLDSIAATDSLTLEFAPPGGALYDFGEYDDEVYG